MVKGKTGNKAKQAATGTGANNGAGALLQTQQVNPTVIATVKQGVVYRGARAAWYAVLCAHQGQPVRAFYAATKATPPSVPKSGMPENPSGWLRFFVRNGVATLSQ